MAQKTIEQITIDHPVTSLDGSELFLCSKDEITSGGQFSVLRNWVIAAIPDASVSVKGTMSTAHFTKVNTLATVANSGAYADLSGKPGVATTVDDGLMDADDKTKLDGIEASANNYVLPEAEAATLGGVLKGAAVADTTDVEDVAVQLNALLAELRAAGVIAT